MYSKRIWSYTILILIFAVGIVPVTPMVGAQLEDWSEDFNLTSNENRSMSPAITSWGSNVYVVYDEDEGGTGYIGERCIWYVNSNDNGKTWNSRIRNDNEPTKASAPKIGVWENKIHVIWFDFEDLCLHYVRSIDNGKTWSNEKPIVFDSHNQINKS